MAKYHVTYEFEINSGDLPLDALAEYLDLVEKASGVFTIWEMGSQGNPKCVKVEAIKD